MKKRVLSLFMTFVLCLTLLPAAAIAEEPKTVNGIAVQAAATEKTESSVASVEINGTTYYYDTLNEAIAAAYEANNEAPLTVTLLNDVAELNNSNSSPRSSATIEMGGKSLGYLWFLNKTLTLKNGVIQGHTHLRSGGGLVLTAPAGAAAAIDGSLNIVYISGEGSGTANVSGAKIGVKGTLRVESSAANAVVISGSEKAVELDSEAYLSSGGRFYGSAEENGSPDTVAVYDADQKTYTVNGETVKKLVSGPQAVVAVTPSDALSVMAGEAQEYTAQYTAEGVVTGSVKGLGDLQAEIENADANGITVDVAENAADGTWKVTVQTAESTPKETYTLKLWSAEDSAVSGSVQFTVSETQYAASVDGTEYRSLSAAIDAAKNTNGTVKLLDNVTSSITVTGGKFTIDLNGKTWTGASDNYALTVDGGEVTVSSTDETGTIISSCGNKHAIYINGGTVHLKENVKLQERLFIDDSDDGSVTFEPGVTVTQNIMTSSSYITKFLTDLALQNASSDYVPFYNVRTNEYPLGYVTVVAHPEHSWEGGVCDQCGYVCGHSRAKDEDTACPDCGATFIADATAADGTVTRYTNADAALAAAAGNVKIEFVSDTYTLKNVAKLYGSAEIDLNGATLQYASDYSGAVLQMNKSYDNIAITLKNGTIRNTGEGAGIELSSTTYDSARTVLTLEDVTVIGGTNNYGGGYSVDVANRGNMLTVKSGSFSGPLYVNLAENTVKLYGGTYQDGIKSYTQITAEDYAALLDNSEPAKQYAYADGDGSVITYDEVATRMNDRDDTNNSIQVVEHTHEMGGTNTCTACGFVCTAHKYENGVCAICHAECPHANVDTSTRVCSDCSLTMVAAATVKDSENNDVTTYTADLAAAMNKAADGTTFTLLADVTLNEYIDVAGKPAKTLTLDLQDHTIHSAKFAVGELNIGDGTAGTLKITGTGSLLNEYTAILVWEDGKLDLTDWSGGTISSVGLGYNNEGSVAGKSEPQITVGADAGRIGSLEFRNWYVSSISASMLEGGSYDQITMNTDQQSVNIETLLPTGYAFQKNDGTLEKRITTIADMGAISSVSVVKCTAHETEGEDNHCIYCNADAAADAAAKMEMDGRTVYCADLPSAFDKANAASGTVTINLLQDVTDLNQALVLGGAANWKDNDITLDLNGKTLSGTGGDSSNFLVVDTYGTVTIRDSGTDAAKNGLIKNTKPRGNYAVYVSTGKLIIEGGNFESADDDADGYALAVGQGATLNINGGTFSSPVAVYSGIVSISGGTFASLLTFDGTAISSLLADGYGFKKNGVWLTEEDLAKTTAANITAAAAPIKSITLTMINVTTNEVFYGRPDYGLSNNVRLDAQVAVTEGTDYTTKWYAVDDDNVQTTEISGADDNSYTLPSDLDAGSHLYRFTVTVADGSYSASKDIRVRVNKADLANAEAWITPSDGVGCEVKKAYVPDGLGGVEADVAYLKVNGITLADAVNGKLLDKTLFTVTGDKATEVGTYTLRIEPTTSNTNFTGAFTKEWEIVKHKVDWNGEAIDEAVKTYDGTDLLTVSGFKFKSLAWEGYDAIPPSESASPVNKELANNGYEIVDAHYDSAGVGGKKTISFKVKLLNDSYTFEDGSRTKSFKMSGSNYRIEKAELLPGGSVTAGEAFTIVNKLAKTYEIDLAQYLPALTVAGCEYGDVSYGELSIGLRSQYYSGGAPGAPVAEIKDGKVILPILPNGETTEGEIGEVQVTVTSANYKDFVLIIKVNAISKIEPTGQPTLSKKTLTYGELLSAIALSGSMKDGDKEVSGTFVWTEPDAKLNAGTHQVDWRFTPTDGGTYMEASGTATVVVNKVTPTGTPKYTTITASGKTLADAALAVNESWPDGTVQWVDADGKALAGDTEVKANTSYKWRFTPTDANNYNTLEASVTLYSVSTGGGGGSSSTVTPPTTTETETTTDPDGTTTKTETKSDGSTVETVTKPDGSTTTTETKTETKPDGSTTTTETKSEANADGSKSETKSETTTAADGSKTETKSETKTEADGTKSETKSETKTEADGSKTETKSETKVEADGTKSETKSETKTDANGVTSGTETTQTTAPNGSTGTTTTTTENGNTKTEAEAKISEKAVEDAKQSGEAVKVPTEVKAGENSNSAPTVKVELPKDAGETKIEIPVSDVNSGTVAVIVHEDGTEEIVKSSTTTENGLQLKVDGSTTIKVIDNSKTFDDTQKHWSRDEVNFVASRELFNGVGNKLFGVNESMTRGMVNTVLARLAGVDTTPKSGQKWYEIGTEWARANGITDGTNPEASVTREQLAAMLYRYAGSPAVNGELGFADAEHVSGYAENALLWAVQNGIMNGVGNNCVVPSANAERAQVAAMMARYLKNVG